MSKSNRPSQLIFAIITFFLGGLGIHRFITGHIISGVLYLISGGIFGIGWLLDFIFVLVSNKLLFE